MLPVRSAGAPLKLGAVLVPEPSRKASTLDVRRLGAMDGLQQLLRFPRLTMWRASEPIGRLFELTAEIAQGLPVYRATVPWGPPFPPGSPRSSWRALASAQPPARGEEFGAPPCQATAEGPLTLRPMANLFAVGDPDAEFLDRMEERLAATGEFDSVWRPAPGWVAGQAPLPDLSPMEMPAHAASPS